MADSDTHAPLLEKDAAAAGVERLRYLQFVHAAAIHAVLLAARIYASAKESAGPLQPGVQAVEGTVKSVVGPVLDKYQGLPLGLLKFVDLKVCESVEELQRHVPAVVKEAPVLARSVAGEVQKTGIVGSAAGLARSAYAKCEPTAKALYAKYEPTAKALYAKYEPAAKAEQCAASAWKSLNRLPLVPRMAQVVVPAAAELTERYNSAVSASAEKGYAMSAYLPLITKERIAKVFAASDSATAAAAAY